MTAKALQKLSEHALEALKHRSRQGRGNTQREAHSRHVERLTNDCGKVTFDFKPRLMESEAWGLADQYRFVTEALKPLSSFSHCAEVLARSLRMPREHVESRLARYLQVLVSAPGYKQDRRAVRSLSQQFLRELQGEPVPWAIEGALRGIVLETDQCQFGYYRLRRPVAGDFELEQGVDDERHNPLLTHPPSALLEFETCARDHFEVRQTYARVLNLLCLYRLGSVGSIALVSTPRAVLQIAGTVYNIAPVQTPYAYPIGKADQGPLTQFVERHLAGPTPLDFSEQAASVPRTLCRAFNGYTRALFSEALATQVIFSLGALEELLLQPTERSAAGSRLLGQRLNMLLEACGHPLARPTTILEQASAMRHALHRGLEAVDTELSSPVEVARSVLEYARLVLIVFSQLGTTVDTAALLPALEGGTRQLRRFLNGIELPS